MRAAIAAYRSPGMPSLEVRNDVAGDISERMQEVLPREALHMVAEGGDAGCALNAADEVAVQAFLDERIGFQEIVPVNRTVLERRPGRDGSIEHLLEADAISRRLAREEVNAAAAHSGAAAPGA